MFLPWWVLLFGGFSLFYFGLAYGSGSHVQSCEWCACDECEAYHENDHVADAAAQEAEPYFEDEESAEIHAMVEKERAEEEVKAARRWRKKRKTGPAS